MNDSIALQQIENGPRALFDYFICRAIESAPELADDLRARAAGVLSSAARHGHR